MELRHLVDDFIAGGSVAEIPAMVATIQAALHAEPDKCETLRAGALFLSAIGQQDLAEELIRKAVAVAPERFDLRSVLADILRRSGRPDEAVVELTIALEHTPDQPEVYERLMPLLLELGLHDSALAVCSEAAERGLLTPTLMIRAGQCLGAVGRRDDAVPRLLEAKALLQPGDGALVEPLMETLFQLGGLDEVVTVGAELAGLGFDSADLQCWIGRAAFARQQWDEAATRLAAALVRLDGGRAATLQESDIRWLRGEALFKLGRSEAAVAELRAGLDHLRQVLDQSTPAARFGAHHPEGLVADRRQRPKAYHMISIAWGREYADMLVRCVLACHLAPRNAATLRALPSLYRLFSTPEDFAHIRETAVFKQLEELTEVEFVPVDTAIADDMARYRDCQQRAILAADQADAAIVMLPADGIINDGYLAYVVAQMEAGKRAVLNVGPRVDKEACSALLDRAGARRPDGALVLESRQLVDMVCRTMHPVGRSLFVDAPELLGGGPYHLYWSLPGVGFLARGFSLDPLCVYPVVKNVTLVSTMDMYFAYQVVPDFDDIVVVTDSDDLVGVSLTPTGQVRDPRRIERSVPEYGLLKSAWWIRNEADPHQCRFATKDVLFHHSDETPEVAAVRQQAAAHVSTLLKLAFQS